MLEVKNLAMHFHAGKGFFTGRNALIKAVDGISFDIDKGGTFGLVGESGCGKTTAGRTIARLYEPSGGRIVFDGVDITNADMKEMKPIRRKMQMVFQDPYASLDPRMTAADIIGEPLDIHRLAKNKKARQDRISELLELVSLNRGHAGRYPHEFSGGQRQRIAIARALAVKPGFVICDEPLSALDVSVQAQIVNMLEDLQDRFGLAYLFIAHDLSMVRHISKRTGVMYMGKLVESAPSGELHAKPAHPYTRALLMSIPAADPVESRKRKSAVLAGEAPSPVDPPSGCRFRTRCGHAVRKCAEQEPAYCEISPGHMCACHMYEMCT